MSNATISPELTVVDRWRINNAEAKRLRRAERNLKLAGKVSPAEPLFTADALSAKNVPDLRKEASRYGMKGARVAKRDALVAYLLSVPG